MRIAGHFVHEDRRYMGDAVRYFTGKPCRVCQGTFRYSLTRSCVNCARLKARVVSLNRKIARHRIAVAALVRLGVR